MNNHESIDERTLTMPQEIGVIGLAVMGKNLAWNIESRGYSVSVYNRSREKTDEMMDESKEIGRAHV